MPTLVYRRHRGDAIEAFKYLKGLYEVDCTKMLPLYESSGLETRGNGMKLAKTYVVDSSDRIFRDESGE